MEFDLAKAIVYRHERMGKRFVLSPAALAMVNEVIGREQMRQVRQSAATEPPALLGGGAASLQNIYSA